MRMARVFLNLGVAPRSQVYGTRYDVERTVFMLFDDWCYGY